MQELDVIAQRTSSALRTTMSRLGRLVRGLFVLTLLVGGLTYVTGLWVSHSNGWKLGGFILCFLPAFGAGMAWLRIMKTGRAAPKALDDLRVLLRDQRSGSPVDALFDYDTQQPIGLTTRSLTGARQELMKRRKELPALFATLKAVTTVPGLAALAVFGLVAVGGLGTILLIVGLLK